MAVTVKLVGALRHMSGKNQLSISHQKAMTLMDLITKISKETPELKPNLISQQPDEPKANALILVNGREISVLDGLETQLNDGDEIVFVPVVHGG
jgi:molybdopterin synthase sulfur carrier subunit